METFPVENILPRPPPYFVEDGGTYPMVLPKERKTNNRINNNLKLNTMRKVEFEVPQEAMTEFANELASRNLNNTVTGTTEEGEIIIEVEYDKEESYNVDELEEILEKIRDEQEEENEEDDDN